MFFDFKISHNHLVSNTISSHIFHLESFRFSNPCFLACFDLFQTSSRVPPRGENPIAFFSRRAESTRPTIDPATRGHRSINTLRNNKRVSVSNRVSRSRARIVIFGALGAAYFPPRPSHEFPPCPNVHDAQSCLRISTSTGSNRLKSDETSSIRSDNFRFFTNVHNSFVRE